MKMVGLLPQGGTGWIVGIIYIHNLIRALQILPERERPDLCFLLGPGSDIKNHAELGNILPTIYHFTHLKESPIRQKLRQLKKLVMGQTGSTSLRQLVKKKKIQVLFPLQESLGKDFPIPWIGWVPDFQHKRLPQFFSQDELHGRDDCFQKLLEESARTVVSSQDAYNDLKRWFPEAQHKVSVFPFRSVPDSRWYEPAAQKVVSHFGLPQKYLMFPSQFWAHKNHRMVFEAIRLFKEKGYSDIALVCTGHTHDYRCPDHFAGLQTFIQQEGLKRHIYFLGLIPRLEQIQLIRAAAAVLQPSLFEGWSALVEDARALGKRIYLSDIAVHREQDPFEANFFDPQKPQQLADALAKDWPSLRPGPDLQREAQARDQQGELILDFARLFLKIVEQVVSKYPKQLQVR